MKKVAAAGFVGGKPRIAAWSFSRWSKYEKCPRQAKYSFIDRLPELEGPALVRGSAVHKQAENFINGTTDAPPEFPAFAGEFAGLRAGVDVRAELEWAFTRAWEPTGWFAKDTWCRVKTDAFIRGGDDAVVIDFKTGRERPEHGKQLELYALGAFLTEPGVVNVRAEMWYLDGGDITDRRFTAGEVPALQDLWERRVAPMLDDTEFEPRPGRDCRWCAYSKLKGGPCPAG